MHIETPRFPESVSAKMVFGPAYSAQIAAALSGKEQRNQLWTLPLRRGTVGHDIMAQADFNTLLDFFNVAEAETHVWRFKDWSDFSVTSDRGRLGNLGVSSAASTGTGSATYQLFKRYVNSANLTLNPKDRVIAKPVSSQIAIYRGGSLQAFGAGAGQISCDTTTGTITWVSSFPGSGEALSWVGQFDVPCRFNTAHMAAVTHLINNESWPTIEIVEIRT